MNKILIEDIVDEVAQFSEDGTNTNLDFKELDVLSESNFKQVVRNDIETTKKA